MLVTQGPYLLVLIAGMTYSVWQKKLTLAGAVTGGIIGIVIYAGSGYMGLVLMALFFIMGTAATAWHKSEKMDLGLVQEKESRRTAAQVWANAGAAALLAVAALFYPQHKAVFWMMLAAAFSSATADTVSSEIGNVYGKQFYNILTRKRDLKGLDGVVSMEGTLAGLAGSTIIAAFYVLFTGWSAGHFFIIMIAGTIGNLADSVLGATVERKGTLSNNGVNFLNTVIAATTAALLYIIFKY